MHPCLKVKLPISSKTYIMYTRIYVIILVALVMITSCKRDDIMQYGGDTYLQFVRSYEDSSLFSFLALPNDDEALAPIPVELVGKPEDRDRTYKISVDPSTTTAPEANYSLPASFTLKANKVVDTAWITLKKTPAIAVAPVKLVLKLESGGDFKAGQTNHTVFILYISNVVARPDWWDDNVEGRFLGTYSDKKYKLFIQVTGLSDLTGMGQEQIRSYTILFKNYLLKEKDEGRTVYEDNGTEMTVALIGG